MQTSKSTKPTKPARLTTILLTAVLLLTTITLLTLSTARLTNPQNLFANSDIKAYTDINIGDYINGFGGLKWRVINKDANGLLVRTDRAVETRAISRARNDYTNSTTNRAASGSGGTNRWHESEMRAWLNGNTWAQGVVFNDAFTNRFKADELAAIAEVTQIQHLWLGDTTANSSFGAAFNMPTPTGSGALDTVDLIENIPANYNTAYQTTINDKIFLLDIMQVHNTANVDTNLNTAARALRNANNASYHIVANAAGLNVSSWTRTPYADNAVISNYDGSNWVRRVAANGAVGNLNAAWSSADVAPALYISPSAIFTHERESSNTLALSNGREQAGYQVYSFTTQDRIDVAEAKSSLTWDNIKGANTEQNNVTTPLAWIVTHQYYNGAIISWSSSNAAVDRNSGMVTRPNCAGENVNVTLTATITKGTASDTLTFNLTVPKDDNDHSWDAGEVTTPPTCTEKGERTFTCQNDSAHTYTEEIEVDPNAHDEGAWHTTLEPTCTEIGEKELRCTLCDHVLETDTIPALDHDFGEWEITTAPTCTEKGEETRYCAHDNTHTQKQDINPTGHTAGDIWFIDGNQRYLKCTVCQEEINHETIATEPNIPVTNGENGTWITNSTSGYTLAFNGNVQDFRSLQINGVTLEKDVHFSLSSDTADTAQITLSKEYLAELGIGEHEIKAYFKDGIALTTLTVSTPAKNALPKWVVPVCITLAAALILTAATLTTLLILKKKKKA